MKSLLLRTLNIYFNTITTTSVGWPTVATGRSVKDITVDAVFFPTLATYDSLSYPNVGNFHIKDKVIFIFILLANRTTGNNTHKTRIYAVQKQAKMIIMDHSCIGLVLLQCM